MESDSESVSSFLDARNAMPHFLGDLIKGPQPGLEAFVQSGEAVRLYDQFYSHRGDRDRIPTNPLLYIPSHTARDLSIDLEAAGVPKNAPGGKIDFHACRNAYVSLIVESGATVKETQELARHSTPQLTMNVYARARDERLSEAVERVGEVVLSKPERVPSVYRLAVGAEQESATPNTYRELRSEKMVEAAGIEPASENRSYETTTCVVSLCYGFSSSPAPTDRIRIGPVQRVSPATPEQE